MNNLSLSTMNNNNTTTVSNVFIDEFMPLANGEFTKIYLYLLRCISNGKTNISIDCLADFFNQTEADIMCALRYWDKAGVLIASTDSTGRQITGITFCNLDSASGSTPDNSSAQLNSNQMPSNHIPSNHMHAEQSTDIYNAAASDTEVPITPDSNETCDPRSAYTPKQLEDLSEQEDFSMLLYAAQTYLGSVLNSSDASVIAYLYDSLQFSSELIEYLIAEQYLAKTLTPTEMQKIFFFYDELHMSADLIEYLVEYCVSRGRKSMRYIEKVALAWADKGIQTVKQAKAASSGYNDTAFSVLGAFGITNRTAGKVEQDYIKKWTDVYCFDSDIIVEACNRTLKKTHQPSFEYADSILSRWKDANVKNTSDIKRIDMEFEQNQQSSAVKRNNAYNNAVKASNNRFNNFNQRNTDIDSLESELISNNG